MKALGSHTTKGLTPVQVRDTARKLASKTVVDQMKGFRALAVMSDWEKKWTTMDREYEIRQLRVFQNMVRRGLIYRKHKPRIMSLPPHISGSLLFQTGPRYLNWPVSRETCMQLSGQPLPGPSLPTWLLPSTTKSSTRSSRLAMTAILLLRAVLGM
ncbi:hypothetical protein LB505_008170 [Fusarium chuoi]|nr:hypothetical protein LB505_008170 [Fusarium chuoi]